MSKPLEKGEMKLNKNNTSQYYQLELVEFDDERKTQRRLVITDPESVEVVSKKSKEAYREQKKREEMRLKDKRGPFVMGKNEPIKELESSGLTVVDRRYFMTLILFAQFNGEPLKEGNQKLNNKRIAELWNIHERAARKRLAKFVSIGLLERIKNPNNGRESNYILNELYFQKGTSHRKVSPGEKFVKIFQNKLSEIIDSVEKINQVKNRNNKNGKVIDFTDVIGLLHAVIPYFHFETYYLVKNPDDSIIEGEESVLQALERNPKALKHLPKTEIGRILGNKSADRRTIDKYMNILQEAGAVMVLRNKNKTRYIIHPDLMFRLDNDGCDPYTRHIRAMFDQHNH